MVNISQLRITVFMGTLIIILWSLAGCGGSTGLLEGDNGSLTAHLARGWDYFLKESYTEAVQQFELVLTAGPGGSIEAAAETGIGWSHARQNNIDTAIDYFAQAATVNTDAAVGLAGCYLARGYQADYARILALLNHIEENASGLELYTSPYTGVAPADLLAILGYCYFLDGDNLKARQYVLQAVNLDGNNETVLDIMEALKSLGLEF